MILRPMTMIDSDFMLELKNYPETRQYAIQTHDEIKKEDHEKWLEKNVQHFKIIEVEISGIGNVKAGAIRVYEGEISVWVNRAFRGNGLATLAIKMTSEGGMTAKIVEGNIGSMRAFISAGFKPAAYTDGYYIFQK